MPLRQPPRATKLLFGRPAFTDDHDPPMPWGQRLHVDLGWCSQHRVRTAPHSEHLTDECGRTVLVRDGSASDRNGDSRGRDRRPIGKFLGNTRTSRWTAMTPSPHSLRESSRKTCTRRVAAAGRSLPSSTRETDTVLAVRTNPVSDDLSVADAENCGSVDRHRLSVGSTPSNADPVWVPDTLQFDTTRSSDSMSNSIVKSMSGNAESTCRHHSNSCPRTSEPKAAGLTRSVT